MLVSLAMATVEYAPIIKCIPISEVHFLSQVYNCKLKGTPQGHHTTG